MPSAPGQVRYRTCLDIQNISIGARAAQVRQEGRAFGNQRADSAKCLGALLAALFVHARVCEHVVDPEELRVRACGRAEKLQEPRERYDVSNAVLSLGRMRQENG